VLRVLELLNKVKEGLNVNPLQPKIKHNLRDKNLPNVTRIASNRGIEIRFFLNICWSTSNLAAISIQADNCLQNDKVHKNYIMITMTHEFELYRIKTLIIWNFVLVSEISPTFPRNFCTQKHWSAWIDSVYARHWPPLHKLICYELRRKGPSQLLEILTEQFYMNVLFGFEHV
jgi:hypothetical protein